MTVKSCLCNYLKTPCKDNCTCVNELSSYGCDYCCTYGSESQKKDKAHIIAKAIDRFGDNKIIMPLPEDYWYWEGRRSPELAKTLHRIKIIALDNDSIVVEIQDINTYEKRGPRTIQIRIKDFLKNATYIPTKEKKNWIKRLFNL